MKIIVVTPAGRERYLKILYKYLNFQKNDFDEWHLWLNTKNIDDLNYMRKLSNENNFIKLINRNIPNEKLGTNYGIKYFFDYCIDKDTIYIRLDDDIVFLEKDFIKKLSEFRINNKTYPLVFANIINNNFINYYHSKNKIFDIDIDRNCLGKLWQSRIAPIIIHKQFLNDVNNNNNNISKYYLENIIIDDYQRVSINAISWIGGDFDNFKEIHESEENWLSHEYPSKIKRPNIICGSVLCSHAGFFTQRTNELENLIQNYNSIIIQ